MRIKFLNTAFVGLMFTLISIVNLANAGLIEKDFNVLNLFSLALIFQLLSMPSIPTT